jgi:hypothetical protein
MRPGSFSVTALALLGCLLGTSAAFGQSAADSAALRGTALDYIEGWYGADAGRMSRALHPELLKRIHLAAPDGEGSYVQTMGRSQLVTSTGLGGGSETPQGERRSEVRILDVFRGAAVIRVSATDFVDYLNLVRTEEGWKILNVLWELREAPGGS